MHKIKFQLVVERESCGYGMENAATALATGREYTLCYGVVVLVVVVVVVVIVVSLC